MSEPIVAVEGLTLGFQTEEGFLEILSNVSFTVNPAEVFALVGESGCGKSVTCLSLGRLLPEPPARYCGGRVRVAGQEVLTLSGRELRRLRGGTVAYVFQEPSVSLNPVLRVGTQISEAVRLHHANGVKARARSLELLEWVGIPDPDRIARAYPCTLSGGMQQRVMVAMALASSPRVLVADEPTTALDVTVQAQILDLLLRLRRESGLSIVLVTHNFGIVAGVADSAAVMYAGQVVERAPAEQLLRAPAHPYTRALLRAVPRPGQQSARLGTIPGRVPIPGRYGAGCRFADRCDVARPDCARVPPPDIRVSAAHSVRCPYSEAVLATAGARPALEPMAVANAMT